MLGIGRSGHETYLTGSELTNRIPLPHEEAAGFNIQVPPFLFKSFSKEPIS